MSENRKQKQNRNKGKTLTWASYLAAQRPSRPAQPAGRRQSSPTSCQEDGARVPDARAHAPATSCFPARCWRPPTTPRTFPGPLALSLALPPPLDLSLSSHPSELVAADRCCRGHRLRLVPLTCLRALRRRPRLLHRPRQAGTHRSVLIALVFGLGRRGSPPSNSRQPTLPRPYCLHHPPLCEPAVLSLPFSLSFRHPST